MSNILNQNTYLRQSDRQSQREGGGAQRKARIRWKGDGEGDPAGGRAVKTIHPREKQKERKI